MDSLANRNSQQEFCASGLQLRLPLLKRCAFIRSQKASRITWHSHDCFELLMILEGSTEYEFDDGHLESLAGGQFLAIAPGVKHRGKHDLRRPARLLGILFDSSSTNAIRNTPFTGKDLKWITQQIRTSAGRTHQMNADIRGHIKSLAILLENFQSANAATLVFLRVAICSILLEVARQISSTRVLEPKQVVQIATDYMKRNLRFEDSIESVAKVANCSRAKLFALFKESTGMTPNDYWLRLRVDHAQSLLRSTNLPVTRIAMDSGFSTSQYFSTVFKKYAGTSPSDYRESECGSR
jgi:AraC-like DNA-binding protein